MVSGLVSVIMPVYNGAKFIEQSVKSVINQSFDKWELIIINDGSNDNTEDIIKKFKDRRIKYIKLNFNTGQPAIPRNIGIECSSSKYIAFIDSDDLWFETKLEEQINKLEANPDFEICYSDYDIIDENDNFIKAYKTKHPDGFLFAKMLEWYECGTLTVVINREILQKLKKPYFRTNLKYSQDHNFFMHIFANAKGCSIKKVLAKYRSHKNNLTHSTSDLHWENALYTGIDLKKTYPKLFRKYKLSFKHYFLWVRMQRGLTRLRKGELEKALPDIKASIYFGKKYAKLYNAAKISLKEAYSILEEDFVLI